jgi:hypothetical protein
MKCKHCGLLKDAHIPTPGPEGRKVWHCPNGSGDCYPAILDVKVELHYRAGDVKAWIATWVHPTAGPGEVAAQRAADVLEQAGRAIESVLETKTAEEKEIEERIKE